MQIIKTEVKKDKKYLNNFLNKNYVFDNNKINIVRKILQDVKKNGDSAVLKYIKKFDNVVLKTSELKVKTSEIESAYKKVDKNFLYALKLARLNIYKFHKRQLRNNWRINSSGIKVESCFIPIEKVGIYVPGGKAAYPSTVLMAGIPAKVAGVEKIVLCTPCLQDKSLSPYVLVAASEIGIRDIYKIGGAQAIAVLGFGTKTIPKVDKIVGPGNEYVTIAKSLVYGIVGIDSLAGPSEVVIVADDSANPVYIASDILAQAEHSEDAMAILITNSEKLVKLVQIEIKQQIKSLNRNRIIEKSLNSRGVIIIVKNLSEAVDIVNVKAPEHLEVMVSDYNKILPKIKNSGAVFIGNYSPSALGDYIAGPSHILPTFSSARFSSALGVDDFVKRVSFISSTQKNIKKIAKEVIAFANIEGFDAHAKSVAKRINDSEK